MNAPEDQDTGDPTYSVQVGEVRMMNTRDVDSSGAVTASDYTTVSGTYYGLQKIDLAGRPDEETGIFDAADSLSNGHVDIYDVDFLKAQIEKYDQNGDLQLYRTEGGITNAEFDRLNMSHVLAEEGQMDDNLINKDDVDMLEEIVLSIYQVDRLMQSDIAGYEPDGSIDFEPDGLITQADVEAAELLFQEYVDINRDGVVDDLDEDFILNIIKYNLYAVSEYEKHLADVNGDGVVDDLDEEMLQKNLALFEEVDITGDGVTDEEDFAEIQEIFAMFEITMEILEDADLTGGPDSDGDGFSDGDGIIDSSDRAVLSNALKYAVDINGDGKYSEDDISIMQSFIDMNDERASALLPLLYSEKLDLTGIDQSGSRTYQKDGVVDNNDIELLKESIAKRVDVNGDGRLDIIDLHITSLEVVLSDYERALFGDEFTTITGANVERLEEHIDKYDVSGDGKVDGSDLTIITTIAAFIASQDVDLSHGAYTEQEMLEAIAALPAMTPGRDSMDVETVLREDLFSGTTSMWTPVNGNWSIQEGVYLQKDATEAGYARTGYYKTWEDVDLSARIKFESYAKRAGVVLRGQDLSNGYLVELSDKNIYFSILENGQVIKEETVQVGQEIKRGEWYTLRVINEGDLFEIYLDGSLKMSVRDTWNKFTSGDVYLYTDHCAAGYKDIQIKTATDLEYISQKGILNADLNGDESVTAEDQDILSSIIAISNTDINGDTVVNEDDKVKLMHISNILQFTDPDEIASTAEITMLEVVNLYDVYPDNKIDELDVNEVERMKGFSDYVQRKTSENLARFDFIGEDGINLGDRLWLIEKFERYLDINGDGIVNESDLQRIESLARAQLIIRSVWPAIEDNAALQAMAKDLVDYDGNGVINENDVNILNTIIDYYGGVDITGDQQVNMEDVYRLDSILSMLFRAALIDPSTIVKVDLVGQFNPITEEYADPDGIIDNNDLEMAIELLNGLYEDTNGDGVISQEEAGLIWSNLSMLFRLEVVDRELEDADLNGDGVVNANDITMFLNNASLYLRTDLDADGRVDERDLDILMDFITDLYQRVQYSEEDIEKADLNGDLFVDELDVVIANRFVYCQDNAITQTIIENIAYAARCAALSGDDQVTQDDVDMVTNTIGASSVSKDAIYSYDISEEATMEGMSLVSPLIDAYFVYDINLAKAGLYDVGLSVRHYDTETYTQAYKFDIYIDGEYYGQVQIAPEKLTFKEASLRAELSEGVHFVEFRTVSNASDAGKKIQLRKVFARAAPDIDMDGIVDSGDETIITTIMNDTGDYSSFEPLTDLSGDGVTDHKDVALFIEADTNMPDMDGDLDRDADDAADVYALSLSADLFGEIQKADLNGDGVIGGQDITLVRAALLKLYYFLDVSAEERALSDINGDGVIDVGDIRLLEEANKFFTSADLNGDGMVSRLDFELLRGWFEAVYSLPVLTLDAAGVGGSIARADLTGPDTNGDGVGDKDGMINDLDKTILENALANMLDIDENARFDKADRDWIERILDLASAIDTQDLLPGVTATSAEVFAFLANYGAIAIDHDSVSSEIMSTSFNVEPEGQVIFESGATSEEPQYMPGWTYNAASGLYEYSGPKYAGFIPGWQAKGHEGQWVIEDGKLKQKMVAGVYTTGVQDTKLEAMGVEFGNGVIEFDTWMEESQHGRAGIEFRAESDEDYYAVVVEERDDKTAWTIKLEKVVGGAYTTLASQDVTYVNAGEWTSFRIYAMGGTFKVRINDELAIDFNDPGLVMEEGAVRFVTGAFSPAAFDNVKVDSFVYEQGLASSHGITLNSYATDWTPLSDGGVWTISEEATEIMQKKADSVPHVLYLDIPAADEEDIVASTGIKFDSGAESAKAGMILRSNPALDDCLEVLLDASKGTVAINRVSSVGGYETLAFEQAPIMRDRWYRLKVKAIGECVEVFVNGRRMFSVVDAQYGAAGKGRFAIFTSPGTRASFRNVEVLGVTPFDDLVSGFSADEVKLLKALNTLSRTEDFTGDVKVDSEDRLIFEIIGRTPGIDAQLLEDVSSAVNLTQLNEEAGIIPGDIDLSGAVDSLDVKLVEEIAFVTSDANAQDIIENTLGLSQAHLFALSAKASSQAYVDALSNGTYEFTDLEFLIRYSDMNGDGAVNYKDTRIFAEKFLFYEFVAAMKAAMETIEFIPSATYGPLSLMDFDIWEAWQQTQFLQKLNEYLTTMDTSQGLTELRDYNLDGVSDFKDQLIFDHYGLNPVAAEDITGAAAYRIDVNGDGIITIDSVGDELNDLDFIHKVFEVTHNYITPDELALVDINGDHQLGPEDIELLKEFRPYYIDLNGDSAVNTGDLMELQELVIKLKATDVNSDGVINAQDKTALNALKDLSESVYDLGESLQAEFLSAESGIQVVKDGNYRLGLSAKALAQTPAGYRFDFKVFVDGVEHGRVHVKPATSAASYGFINLDLGKGNYTVTVEWANPLEDVAVLLENIKLTHSADFDKNGIVELSDINFLSSVIDAEIASPTAYDASKDIDSDGDVDWTDYYLLKRAVETIKDVTGDGVINADDIEKIESIIRLEEFKELYEAADVDGNNIIEQHDIDTLNTVRMIDIDADGIVRAAIWDPGLEKPHTEDAGLDWTSYQEILAALEETGNKDYAILGLMADLELTVDLFRQLDTNGDGVFDILDMPEGIDVTKFMDYNVFREGADGEILSYFDENLIQKSIANLLFMDKFDEDLRRKADLNRDGVVDFRDYELLSELYRILHEGADRNIDGIGELPDASDLEELRRIAVILAESDINSDGVRNSEDRDIILGKFGETEVKYRTAATTEGFFLKEDASNLARKVEGLEDYTLT
ncbi:MAG: dockerin type I domain-containing protein [Candidatus Omnitrophota bacterium]|jgi:hypothetical protein